MWTDTETQRFSDTDWETDREQRSEWEGERESARERQRLCEARQFWKHCVVWIYHSSSHDLRFTHVHTIMDTVKAVVIKWLPQSCPVRRIPNLWTDITLRTICRWIGQIWPELFWQNKIFHTKTNQDNFDQYACLSICCRHLFHTQIHLTGLGIHKWSHL